MSGLKHRTFFSISAEMLAITLISLALLGPAVADNAPIQEPSAAADYDLSVGADNASDLSKLLPILLTSPERKSLAAELEASIRQGDLREAESKLNKAIEMGTLAIALFDRLHDPNLLTSLQTLGIHGDGQSKPSSGNGDVATPATCVAAGVVNSINLADLQQALDQEQSHSSSVSQALATITQEHDAFKARLENEAAASVTRLSSLQEALQQEKERSEAAARELANLQNRYEALQTGKDQETAAASSRISDLEALLQRERGRGDQAVQQLARAQDELRALQASKDSAAASETSRIADLERALAQARMRGDALSQELAHKAEELRALQEPQEQAATPLVLRLEASGINAPLAPARDDAMAQGSQLPPPADVSASQAQGGPDSSGTASVRKEPAPVRTASLTQDTQSLPAASLVVDQPKADPAPVTDTVKAETPPEPPKADARTDDRLLTRADELFRKGDVSGARLLLERLVNGSNARAAFLLAETFDPNVLSKMRAIGIRGDAAKAQEFYAQARALGIMQAGERMQALK